MALFNLLYNMDSFAFSWLQLESRNRLLPERTPAISLLTFTCFHTLNMWIYSLVSEVSCHELNCWTHFDQIIRIHPLEKQELPSKSICQAMTVPFQVNRRACKCELVCDKLCHNQYTFMCYHWGIVHLRYSTVITVNRAISPPVTLLLFCSPQQSSSITTSCPFLSPLNPLSSVSLLEK